MDEINAKYKTLFAIVKFNNFIGWILVITILGIPLGLPMILLGQAILVQIAIEKNTRATAMYLRKGAVAQPEGAIKSVPAPRKALASTASVSSEVVPEAERSLEPRTELAPASTRKPNTIPDSCGECQHFYRDEAAGQYVFKCRFYHQNTFSDSQCIAAR